MFRDARDPLDVMCDDEAFHDQFRWENEDDEVDHTYHTDAYDGETGGYDYFVDQEWELNPTDPPFETLGEILEDELIVKVRRTGLQNHNYVERKNHLRWRNHQRRTKYGRAVQWKEHGGGRESIRY